MLLAQEYGRVLAPHSNFTMFYNFLQFFTIFYNFLQNVTIFYQILHFFMCNYYSTFIIVLQSLWSLHTAAFIGEDWQLKHNDDCVCFSSD